MSGERAMDSVKTVDRCAHCGFPFKEHSYNGACYGICGQFVAVAASPAGAGVVAREAFKAGWRTNATTEQPGSYLDGCEQVDWEEYRRLGLESYLVTLTPDDTPPTPSTDAVRRQAREALEPFARLEIPTRPQGNAGAYSILHKDILAARAAIRADKGGRDGE